MVNEMRSEGSDRLRTDALGTASPRNGKVPKGRARIGNGGEEHSNDEYCKGSEGLRKDRQRPAQQRYGTDKKRADRQRHSSEGKGNVAMSEGKEEKGKEKR